MSGGHSSSGIGDAVKKGVGMFHGTGEAIRGNFNAAVDQASGDRAGVDKNTAIASSGANEIEHGYHRTGHGAGVTPADADRERLNTTHTASTNYGSHSTNTANKLDPRFDSDMDHRGTATGSTNAGHHSNNVANKLDPRIDSDVDHRANPNSSCTPTLYSQTDGTDSTTNSFGCKWEPQHTSHDHEYDEQCNCHAQHIHRGSINGGTNLEPAQKLDPILGNGEGSTNYGPYDTNIANKLGPKVDSDTDHRGTEQGSTNHGPHRTNIGNELDSRIDSGRDHRGTEANSRAGRSGTFARRGTEPSVQTCYQDEIRAAHRSGSDDELRRTSLSADTTAPLDGPRSTVNPHNSDFLNLLDPRVDRNGAKQMRSSLS